MHFIYRSWILYESKNIILSKLKDQSDDSFHKNIKQIDRRREWKKVHIKWSDELVAQVSFAGRFSEGGAKYSGYREVLGIERLPI